MRVWPSIEPFCKVSTNYFKGLGSLIADSRQFLLTTVMAKTGHCLCLYRILQNLCNMNVATSFYFITDGHQKGVETTDHSSGDASDSDDFQDSFQVLPSHPQGHQENLDPSVQPFQPLSQPSTEKQQVTFSVPTTNGASRREAAVGGHQHGKRGIIVRVQRSKIEGFLPEV